MDLPTRVPVFGCLVAGVFVALASSWLARRIGRFAAIGFDPMSKRWRTATRVFVVLILALVTLTSGNYGWSIDEWFQARHGIALVDWYAGVFRGIFVPFDDKIIGMNYYGGAFELLAEIAARALPWERTWTRHLVTAWFGVAGLVGVYLLGSHLANRATGFLALAVLALTPRFYGHFLFNPKDIPFAVGMLFSVYFTCLLVSRLPKVSPKGVLALGVSLGFTIGVRVGGAIALGYFGLALAWWLGGVLLRGRASGVWPQRREIVGVVGCALTVPIVAWAVMLVAWPWAQVAPLTRPFEAVGYYQEVVARQQNDFSVFFEGVDYPLSQIPRYFTVKFMLLSMPEFAILAPVALLPLAAWIRRASWSYPKAKTIQWSLVFAAVVVPLSSNFSSGIIQYDGIRHFLFILPSIAVALAAGLVGFFAGPFPGRLKAGLATSLVALMALTAWDMRTLHPYEYVYFNRSVAGGLAGASERYETDYLGTSYREGVRWLLNQPELLQPGRTRVAGCSGFEMNLAEALTRHPNDALRMVRPEQDPDVALAFTRHHCHDWYVGKHIPAVQRNGIPLLYGVVGRNDNRDTRGPPRPKRR